MDNETQEKRQKSCLLHFVRLANKRGPFLQLSSLKRIQHDPLMPSSPSRVVFRSKKMLFRKPWADKNLNNKEPHEAADGITTSNNDNNNNERLDDSEDERVVWDDCLHHRQCNSLSTVQLGNESPSIASTMSGSIFSYSATATSALYNDYNRHELDNNNNNHMIFWKNGNNKMKHPQREHGCCAFACTRAMCCCLDDDDDGYGKLMCFLICLPVLCAMFPFTMCCDTVLDIGKSIVCYYDAEANTQQDTSSAPTHVVRDVSTT